MKEKIKLLKKHIEDIERKMKDTDIEIPDEPKGITYGNVVQTSGNASYAERAAIKMIESMENEIAYKREQIASLQKNIRDMEADNVIIESNLRFLSKDHMKILELKYGHNKKDWQVGVELSIERSTITRIKQKLIKDIGEWDRLINVHQTCTKFTHHG